MRDSTFPFDYLSFMTNSIIYYYTKAVKFPRWIAKKYYIAAISRKAFTAAKTSSSVVNWEKEKRTAPCTAVPRA